VSPVTSTRKQRVFSKNSLLGRSRKSSPPARTRRACLGQEPSLVLHGGEHLCQGCRKDAFGKSLEVLYIKGSGSDLATIEPHGHPAVRLDRLRKLRALPALTDEQMVNELRLALLDAGAANPSVETLLHAWLPSRFVDHTHADAVLALADQPDAARICAHVYGRGLVWVPYVMPGFELAKRCSDAFDALLQRGETPAVIVLEKHGIFTFGDSAKESYEAMIAAVTRAERHVADARRTASGSAPAALFPRRRRPACSPSCAASSPNSPKHPRNRARSSRSARRTPSSPFSTAQTPASSWKPGAPRPITSSAPRPTALYVESPDYADLDAFGAAASRRKSCNMHTITTPTSRGCAPTKACIRRSSILGRALILLPQVGICAVGRTLKEADAVADVYEHTCK